jgi:hypothetical protein
MFRISTYQTRGGSTTQTQLDFRFVFGFGLQPKQNIGSRTATGSVGLRPQGSAQVSHMAHLGYRGLWMLLATSFLRVKTFTNVIDSVRISGSNHYYYYQL